jgi:hypothetical protein
MPLKFPSTVRPRKIRYQLTASIIVIISFSRVNRLGILSFPKNIGFIHPFIIGVHLPTGRFWMRSSYSSGSGCGCGLKGIVVT